jgi:Zn-dependent membrane protease YugP
MPFFFDSTMLLLIPGIILALYAQHRVKSTYDKYLRVKSASGRTGRDIAEFLLNRNGITNVQVVPGEGFLGDHYNPLKHVVSLSPNNFSGSSIASIAVAAHEVGHAVQHATGYAPLKIRHAILPVSNFGSMLAFPLFLIGFLFGAGGKTLMDIGIVLFMAAVAFQVVTLPVEFDASSRAMKQLQANGVLAPREIAAGREVLSAAALTYVAATAMALLQLLRLVMMRNARD